MGFGTAKVKQRMNYNTDQTLWDNYRKYEADNKPNGGAILTVQDGMIGNGYEVLARFDTTPAAEKVLAKAGYRKVSPHKFKAR